MKPLYIVLISFLMLSSCAKNKTETVAQTPNSECLQYGTCNFNYAQQPGWQSYTAQNGAYVGQNSDYANGYCGCSTGYLPAYNSQYGLGCVQSNQLFPSTTAYPATTNSSFLPGTTSSVYGQTYPTNSAYPSNASNTVSNIGFPANTGLQSGFAASGQFQAFAWNSNQWDWFNQSATPYNPYPDANGCTQSVLRSCDVREQAADSCGANGYCRTTGGGSFLGTCVYN